MDATAAQWAEEEFGHARLGDKRRTKRLVKMAGQLVETPAGRVTQAFRSEAQQQAAYDFLEQPETRPAAIAAASAEAGARRCQSHPFVYVPVDGTSLNFAQVPDTCHLGPVGSRRKGARGLQVMSAIALSPEGVPLGLVGQKLWVRPKRRKRKPARQRPLQARETAFWFHVISEVNAAFDRADVTTRRWYQLDRGGDFQEMLEFVAATPHLVTVRSAQNRRLHHTERLLRETLSRSPVLGYLELPVSESEQRQARLARLSVRARRVRLLIKDRATGAWKELELGVVLVREVHTTPAGEKPIDWLLWSNHPCRHFEEAVAIVDGYAQRFAIEPWHRTWKNDCGIEEAQLRTRPALEKWATLTAAVAMRLRNLVHLARVEPQAPATRELTQYEIDAAILLSETTDYRPGEVPPIGKVVDWIARLGGYTGKSSGGPPGTTVVGRGLERLAGAAKVLETQARRR